MFNLLGRQTANPAGSSIKSSQSPIQQLFSEQDVRELFETFNLDQAEGVSEETAESHKLILSKSKDGLIITQMLTEQLKEKLNTHQGRLKPSSLADQFDVDEKTIRRVLLQNGSWAMFSADSSSVLTRHEQERLQGEIESLASTRFIDAQVFCDEQSISVNALQVLIKRIAFPKEGDLEVLSFDVDPNDRLSETSGFYVSCSTLRKTVEAKIIDHVGEAYRTQSAITWNPDESFLGIKASHFVQLAREVVGRLDPNIAQGAFSVPNANQVEFLPQGYLTQQRDQKLSELVSGQAPYCDLKELTDSLPGLFSDVHDAEKFVQEDYGGMSGTDHPVQVFSHFAVSSSYLNNIVLQVEPKVESVFNLEDVLSSFPVNIQPQLRPIVQDKLVSISGLKGRSVRTLGDFAVSQSWITNIETKARELAIKLAEESWEQEEQSKSKSAAISFQIKKQTSEAIDIQPKLLDMLWQDEKSDLAGYSTNAFNDRLNELEFNSEAQFISFWTSRVVDRVRLYSKGISALEEGTLKTQLTDVLQSHISQELVPGAITRVKAKKLVRTSRRKIPSRLEKLVGSITAEGGDLPSTTDELEKFNTRMEIPIYDDDDIARKKQTHLEEMLLSMQKDKDGPRLFLCLVIILFASKSNGVVYATGKYAPRLLKLLKPTLDQELAQQLEQWKEAVKGGAVTHEMRADMRKIAAESLLK